MFVCAQIVFDRDLDALLAACNPPVADDLDSGSGNGGGGSGGGGSSSSSSSGAAHVGLTHVRGQAATAAAALVTHDRLRALDAESQLAALFANC